MLSLASIWITSLAEMKFLILSSWLCKVKLPFRILFETILLRNYSLMTIGTKLINMASKMPKSIFDLRNFRQCYKYHLIDLISISELAIWLNLTRLSNLKRFLILKQFYPPKNKTVIHKVNKLQQKISAALIANNQNKIKIGWIDTICTLS